MGHSIITVGQKFGRYTILKPIGSGGMGEVFLAEDAELERLVAIKVLSAEVANDTVRISRFIQEARSASALNHPNILTIYEVGEFEGLRFMASEYVEGRTLRTVNRYEKPTLPEILRISIQIVSALDAAHLKGIVHRDIKPDNVMIRRDGIVKVLDFGLAKLVEQESRQNNLVTDENAQTVIQFPPKRVMSSELHTLPGVIMGTPHFMSPEQARGKNIDRQTDIFSFGVVLYEMLAGQLPFVGETPSDIIASILTSEPTPLPEIYAELPIEISEIVRRALEKNKVNRYQTSRDLLDDLERAHKRLEFQKQLGQPYAVGHDPRGRTSYDGRPKTTGDGVLSNELATAPTVVTFSIPNNLSGELTALIGRSAELANICESIRAPETRLLTLTGVGGTGKTRLAKEIALRSISSFTDGVFFVDLSALSDHHLVEPAIEQTLGVKDTGADSLVEFLQDKRILLILDNFEQITGAASQIGELLAATSELKILVTSRVRLNLSFEKEFTLQPLAVPGDDETDISKNASVALFVERAKAVKTGFALTDENLEVVADICRRLDGLPLAIELAAVQVKMFAPRAIKKRLETSFQILTTAARNMPERQRTMRGAIAWSYDLLDDDERDLFNRVYVFRGGFTLESAEAVGNSDGKLNIFECLSALVDKSLLVQIEQADGEPRFRMLQVVREFAREEPERTGEDAWTRRLHATYFADFADLAMEGFRGKDAVEHLERTEIEHDNLRLALEWSLAEEPEIALRIAGALPQFWLQRGHLSEGAQWLSDALDKNGENAAPRFRARALYGLGHLSWNRGDVAQAERCFEESLAISRAINDQRMIAIALDGFGIVKMMQSDFAAALRMFEEGLLLATAVDDRYSIARLANCIGETYRTQKDYASAKPHYEQCLSTARQGSFKHLVQLATVNLGAVACLMQDYAAARKYAFETLKLAEEAGDKLTTGFALEIFVAVAVAGGDETKAARLFGAIETIYELIGYKIDGTDAEFLNYYVDQVRASLGDKQFERARTKGRRMSMAKASEMALRIC